MSSELFDAVAAGDIDTVRAMVAADPAVSRARNAEGVPAIVWARYTGKADVAEVLAEGRDDLDLAEACVLGRTDVVRGLLDAGADIGEVTPDGFTPLHYAAFFGHLDLARLLTESGADVDARATGGMTVQPLHSAAAGRHTDVALLLIDAGADVTGAQQHGWTALHAAAQHGDEALTAALLDSGADPVARADDGTTPVELARAGGFPELAQRLERAAED